MGRFINADDISYLGADGTLQSYNLFSYCKNNPCNLFDKSGEFGISLSLIGIVVGAVVGAVAGAVSAYTASKDKGIDGSDLIVNTVLGAVGGGVAGGMLGACGAALITKLTGIVGFSVTRVSIVTIKDITLLGNIPGYVDIANSVNAGFYHIPEKVEESLPVAQQWANNAQYLQDAYSLGSQFVLSPDKVIEAGKRFWLEVQFLMDNGIPWIMP